MATQRTTRVLGVAGSKLTLDGEPFYYQGLTFFNGLYNPAFNLGDDAQLSLAWRTDDKARVLPEVRFFFNRTF